MSTDKRVRNPIANPEVFLVADGTSAQANLGYSNAEQVKTKLGVNSTIVETIGLTTYNLKPADNAKILEFTSPAPITVTLPSTTAAGLPVGFNVTITQKGTGAITFLPSTTEVNLRHPYNSNSTLGQFATCRLYVSSVNEYILSGDTNNQGAIAQPGAGQSSLISTIKEISDTESYFLLLSDNNTTLQVNTSSDFYLLLPDDLPPGYNVEIFKIGSGRIILSPQGRSNISHPDLHNALTTNFAKARLQIISNTNLNTLWSFTGDTSFVELDLINEYYNLVLSGDLTKSINPNTDTSTEIPFVFTVKKSPPEIPFKTFRIDPIGTNTGTPSDVIIQAGQWGESNWFSESKPTLQIESGTIYRFDVQTHHRLQPNTFKFRIMRNGVPITSPEVITTDQSSQLASPSVFDRYTVTWNVPASIQTGVQYTYGWHTGTTAIASTVGNINFIDRKSSNLIVNWSISLIENISATDFVGDLIPQGSLSFSRSLDVEEKTFSIILKNVPDLTVELQKIFKVNILSVSTGAKVINNSLESQLGIFTPATIIPDPSAFVGFQDNVPITSISSLGVGRFSLKVDSRNNTHGLTVNDFLTIDKASTVNDIPTGVKTISINSGAYLITNVTANAGQDTDVTIVEPIGYITASNFSSINEENVDRTLVTLTIQWIGFTPSSSVNNYPLLVQGHVTNICNSFTLPETYIRPDYLFRYAPREVSVISTINNITTHQVKYIVNTPYSSSYKNFPTGYLDENDELIGNFNTIIDQNNNLTPYSGTVTLQPIHFFSNFSNRKNSTIEHIFTGRYYKIPYSITATSSADYDDLGRERLIIEVLPRLNTISGSKVFSLIVGDILNSSASSGRKLIRNFRLSFQDSLNVEDQFSLTYTSQMYYTDGAQYGISEGVWKITNIIPRRVSRQSTYVDIEIEYLGESVNNQKPYIGVGTLIKKGTRRLQPRAYSFYPPIIQTSSITYTEGKSKGEYFGIVVATPDPEAYYPIGRISGFQIIDGDGLGYLNITSSGQLSLTNLGVNSYLNNFQELPNQHTITVRTYQDNNSSSKQITLNVQAS